MRIRYFGWSGIVVTHGEWTVGFDLPENAASFVAEPPGGAETTLCVTHGHLDHCAGLRAQLAAARRSGNVPTVVGPADVVAHGSRHEDLPADRLRPVELARIAATGFGLPVRSATLGFRVEFPDGRTVLNYAEGLHHRTEPREVAGVADELGAEILLVALEPEGSEAIPRWIAILEPKAALLYEAHRPWRDAFDLPPFDLAAYGKALSGRFPGITVDSLLHTGDRIRLE